MDQLELIERIIDGYTAIFFKFECESYGYKFSLLNECPDFHQELFKAELKRKNIKYRVQSIEDAPYLITVQVQTHKWTWFKNVKIDQRFHVTKNFNYDMKGWLQSDGKLTPSADTSRTFIKVSNDTIECKESGKQFKLGNNVHVMLILG